MQILKREKFKYFEINLNGALLKKFFSQGFFVLYNINFINTL